MNIPYLPETYQYLSQLTGGQPSALWTYALNNLIRQLIIDGNWQLLDRMWIFATDVQQHAKVSIVNPKSTQITEVPNGGTLTWTKDVGYSGDGVASYLNSNYNPGIQGVNFTLNSCSFGSYRLTYTAPSSTYFVDMGGFDATNNLMTFIAAGLTTGQSYAVNESNVLSYATTATTGSGFWAAVRTSGSAMAIYKNGVSQATSVNASNGIPNVNQFILAFNNNGTAAAFSPNQLGMAFFGSGSINQLKLYNAWNTFLSAI